MGDDLMVAQQFVDLCEGHLDSLIKGKVEDKQTKLAVIDDIKTAAMSGQARAIARLADQLRDDTQFDPTGSRYAGSLLALNKLVQQYKHGLGDISIMPTDECVTHTTAYPDIKLKSDPQAEFEQAAHVLGSLLPIADEGARPSLKLLTEWHMPSEPEEAPKTFHDLMPDLTDTLLRLARQQNKTVSVSFSADRMPVSSSTYTQLKSAMIHIGRELVRQTVETAAKRQAKGLSRSAHIAITARQDKSVMHILVTCKGRLPSQTLLNSQALSALKAQGARCGFDRQNDLISVALADIDYKGRKTETVTDSLALAANLEMEMRA